MYILLVVVIDNNSVLIGMWNKGYAIKSDFFKVKRKN